MKKFQPLLLLAFVVLVTACSNKKGNEITIFHAGSLTVPVHKCIEAYNKQNPEVIIKPEAAGSLSSARKITELSRPCDLLMLADHTIIDELIIPQHASWNLIFASNEISIVYLEKSKYSLEINDKNWTEILMRSDVRVGRADPDKDPCGYRTVMTLRLAEKMIEKPGFATSLLEKDRKYMRSKETDLIPLLGKGEIDYIFLYRSVALQHGLKTLLLSDSVNLKNPALNEFYATVSVTVAGKTPTDSLTLPGQAITYGITMPKNGENPVETIKFLQFVMQQKELWASMGQPILEPVFGVNVIVMPVELKGFEIEERNKH